MTPAEVLEEMRDSQCGLAKPRISVWADALERAMREPVAYLSKTLDSHGNMRSRELSWVPIPSTSPLNLDRINHPLFMLPPNAVGIINEQQREIELLRGKWWVIRTKEAEIEQLTADLASVRKAARDLLARIDASPERTLLEAAIFE